MRTNYYKQFVRNILGGSAQPNANAQQLSEAEIVLPINEELLFNFYSSIFKIDDKMYNNQDEIQTLTQLRDTLLPKLMSGEMRVND